MNQAKDQTTTEHFHPPHHDISGASTSPKTTAPNAECLVPEFSISADWFSPWFTCGVYETFKNGSIIIDAIVISGLVSGITFSLNWWLRRKQQRLVVARCIDLSAKISTQLKEINSAGNKTIGRHSDLKIIKRIALEPDNKKKLSSFTITGDRGVQLINPVEYTSAVYERARKSWENIAQIEHHFSDLELYLSLNSASYNAKTALFLHKFLEFLRSIALSAKIISQGIDDIERSILSSGVPSTYLSNRLEMSSNSINIEFKKFSGYQDDLNEKTLLMRKFAFFGKYPYTVFNTSWLPFGFRWLINGMIIRPFCNVGDHGLGLEPRFIGFRNPNSFKNDVVYRHYNENKNGKNFKMIKRIFRKNIKVSIADSENKGSASTEISEDELDELFWISLKMWRELYIKFWGSMTPPPPELVEERFDDWMRCFNEVRLENGLEPVPTIPESEWKAQVNEMRKKRDAPELTW